MFKKIEGRVLGNDGNPVIRKLYLLDRNTGFKMGETTSDANGYYSFKLGTSDPQMVVMVSMPGDNSNSYVLDYLVPVDHSVPTNTDIGVPGEAGFGQGNPVTIPSGFSPLEGYDNPYHENYGTYRYGVDGSIMIWIPKFYYKWGTGSNGLDLNDCDIKGTATYADEAAANADGYALHRAFIDGGEIKDGFFVDKYMNSKNPDLNVASSLYLGRPLSTATGNNPISVLGVDNALYGPVDAAKLRGSGFFCMSLFQARAISMLSYAHGRASSNTTYCGWYGSTYKFPKGNINGGVAASPSNPTYTGADLRVWQSNITTVILTGGFSKVEMTTHNGQKCGVTDVCGNMSDVTPGLTYLSSSFRLLKESIAMKDVTSGTTSSTDLWNTANLTTMYDDLGATLSDFGTTGGWVYYTTTNQIFDETTIRSSNGYKLSNIGIPNTGVISTTNPNALGGGIYRSRITSVCPLSFGDWSTGDNAGVWALYLGYPRTNSNTAVGFRSAFYP